MENFEIIKFKTKDFLSRNKRKIKVFTKIGVGLIVAGEGAMLLINYRKIADENIALKEKLFETYAELLKSKELHREKDEYMCELASRLLRQGISEGGQLMASRKEYLKTI